MATLYDYYKKLGKSLPSVSARASIASQAGIKNYSGTASENATLLSYLNKAPSSSIQNNVNQTRQGVVDQNNLLQDSDLDLDAVIGAGPNAGLTARQVQERDAVNPPTFGSSMPEITRNAGESNESYKARILNQPFVFAGGESANSGLTNAEAMSKKNGLDYVPLDKKMEKGTGAYTETTKGIIGNQAGLQADPNTVKGYYEKLGLQNFDSEIDYATKKRIEKLQEDSEAEIDEEKIRKSFKNRIQGSIDAINQTYASMLGKAKVVGDNNQGVSRAISARSGLLGSSFDEANVAKISKANLDTENSIEGERAGQINRMLNDEEDRATTYIESLRKRREEANQQLMDTILTRETRTAGKASKLAQYLLTQGIKSLDEMTASDQENIAKNYGVDPETLAVEFDKALRGRETEDLENDKNRYVSISDGSQLYDKQTGKVIENQKNFADKKVTGGGESGTYVQGANPVVDAWVKDLNAGKATIANVPANLKNAVTLARNANVTDTQSKEDQFKAQTAYEGVMDTIKNAKELADSAGQSGMRQWLGNTFKGATPFNQLVQLTDSIKTNVLASLTDPSIKKFFGPAMSNADVKLMMTKGTPLSAENMTPQAYKAELERIQRVFTQLKPTAEGYPTNTSTEPIQQILYKGILYYQDENGDLTPVN